MGESNMAVLCRTGSGEVDVFAFGYERNLTLLAYLYCKYYIVITFMCPITFREIEIAKDVFKAKLKTIYHTRVQYPDEIKKAEEPGNKNAPSSTPQSIS